MVELGGHLITTDVACPLSILPELRVLSLLAWSDVRADGCPKLRVAKDSARILSVAGSYPEVQV